MTSGVRLRWCDWLALALFGVCLAPGLLHAAYGGRGGVVSGVLSAVGPLVAFLPLVFLSFRSVLSIWLRLSLWGLMVVAVAGLYFFAEDWSSAF